MAQSLVDSIFERPIANVQEVHVITQNQLLKHKDIADELGDLMLNFLYNGLYQVFVKYSAIMLYIVNQQLKHSLDVSLTGFHLFSFMNQSIKGDLTMLKRICKSQATFAANKALELKMIQRKPDNPFKPRVGYWGYDIVKNSPLSHLMHNILIALSNRSDLIVFLIGEMADSDPVSKHLENHFKTKNQLTVLPSKATLRAVLKHVSDLSLHSLVDLSRYTHCNYLDVWHKHPAEYLVQFWVLLAQCTPTHMIICCVDLMLLIQFRKARQTE